ncbi:hypothetical protein PSQ20_17910 [Curvibacter sp. RS43]|uniref:hypothetical protein n=1 Tax=Curvibacter microcysteis TaxID=3026419 RepID=UPI0023627242|nr:hypothetical protein [Curvibacter sp. RS43]MDD0812230.1 hypothetical protein [Curvibacter sp. RS43]
MRYIQWAPVALALSGALFSPLSQAQSAASPSPASAASAPACPAPGRPAIAPVNNPGFVAGENGIPKGWRGVEHVNPGHYLFESDTAVYRSAPPSFRLRRIGTEAHATLEQTIRVAPCWRGKTARLSSELKTQGADGAGGGLILQMRDIDNRVLLWNHMNDSRVIGTQDWKRYSVELPLPEATEEIRIGILLDEQGTLWADDVRLEILN